MSAFVVGTDHIDYLLTATAQAARHPYGIGGVLVSDAQAEHIRAMDGADSLSRYGVGTQFWHPEQNLAAAGRVLLAENIRSVHTRYPDDTFEELPGPRPMVAAVDYVYKNVRADLVYPAQTIHAIDCWQYQTSEYDGHEQAPGWQFTNVLYKAAVRDLIGEDRKDLQWEWDREKAAQ